MGANGGLDLKLDTKIPIILVVEDEVLVRMMIADHLRTAGYTVLEASNAHEARDVLRHTSDIRLIVSDLRMPGAMDGVALARLVRAEYPSVKIVLTSGHVHALDWTEHDGFFAKPYDPKIIISHIKTLLE